MRSFLYATSAAFALATAAPAFAGIAVLADHYDLSTAPLTVGLDNTNTFTFTYDPRYDFDFDPTLVQTMGTAATTAFGGFLGIPLQPSTFFTDPPVFIDGNISPGFAQFPDATRIPYSLSPGDLGLRVTMGGQDYYGYARITGPDITVAFNTTAGAGITAGAVPEPAVWAMLLIGFGTIGGALRLRNRKPKLTPALA